LWPQNNQFIGGSAVIARFRFVFEHAVIDGVVGVVFPFMAPVEISVTRLPPSTRAQADPLSRNGFRNNASSTSQLTAGHQIASSLQIDGSLGALADEFECRHCSFSRLTLIDAESTPESIPQTAQRVFGFALS
jgi:hypothetical protein